MSEHASEQLPYDQYVFTFIMQPGLAPYVDSYLSGEELPHPPDLPSQIRFHRFCEQQNDSPILRRALNAYFQDVADERDATFAQVDFT